MRKLADAPFGLFCAIAVLSITLCACSGGLFTGNSGKTGSVATPSKKSGGANGGSGVGGTSGNGAKGKGANGGSDASDGTGGDSSGGTLGGKNSGGGGKDSSGGGNNSSGGGNNSSGGGGSITGGGNSSSSGGDSGLSDGGETSIKTRHDMTIQRTRSEQKFTMIIETLVKGSVVQTNSFDFGEDDPMSAVAAGACLNGKDTCARITVKGEATQIVGQGQCTFVQSLGSNSMKVDFDADGKALIGSCTPGESDTFTITCPQSKTLLVQNCSG